MKRSKHRLSHHRLFTTNMGQLTPCALYEVLPGDTFQHSTSALIRCSPLLAPVMHPVQVRIHHWFVPSRILWDDFEDFITGGEDGMDASIFPTINITFTAGTPPTGSGVPGELADYLGIPTGINNLEVNALPFRAYAMIFNEWYRDQDLVNELPLVFTSGNDGTTSVELQLCAWEKDYFTSARPTPQKGPDITIPIGDTAPITGIGVRGIHSAQGSPLVYREHGGDVTYDTSKLTSEIDVAIKTDNATAGSYRPQIFADLSQATGISINQLREAMALQRFQEARSRYGSRYVEYLAYLGVRSSDQRLQRPEYLGGGQQTVQFSEVLQTAEGTDPVGELRGHGIAAMRSNAFRRYFEEHGYVLSLMSVRPRTMYTQGLNRLWNRRVKEDFFQKELAHIGQQEVLNKELYASHADPDGTFGFQDRYDEYRRTPSLISGEFRTSQLDYWHFARQFASDPALNASFVECLPTNTPFASQDTDKLYVMCNHRTVARRMVPKTGTSYIF